MKLHKRTAGITAAILILTTGGCMTSKQITNEAAELYPAVFAQEEVQVKSQYGTLYGTLDLPAVAGKVPVILMISGSGATDRDGNSEAMQKPNDSLKMLSGHLVSLGYAVLRYDKRGVGASKAAGGPAAETEFAAMIDDALLWAEFLKNDPRFDSLGILGHSEGSLVGICAAYKADAEYLISIAGAGRPAGEMLREQLEPQPKFIRKKAFAILNELEEGRTVAKVPFYLMSLFNPLYQKYFISWNKYDPADCLSGLEIPVLVVQGSTDIQTNMKDAETLAAAGLNAELAVIEGMNHILKDAPANRMKNLRVYTKQGVPISTDLVYRLEQFLLNR